MLSLALLWRALGWTRRSPSEGGHEPAAEGRSHNTGAQARAVAMETERALEVYGEGVGCAGPLPLPPPRAWAWAALDARLRFFLRPDIIRTIRDPEKPRTLEELDVVTESCVEVLETGEDEFLVTIRFTPTVPHCSLATLIGGALWVGRGLLHGLGAGGGGPKKPPPPSFEPPLVACLGGGGAPCPSPGVPPAQAGLLEVYLAPSTALLQCRF